MKVDIQFNCDNAAFTDYPDIEIERILRSLADTLRDNPNMDGTAIMDVNGNNVGEFCIFDD